MPTKPTGPQHIGKNNGELRCTKCGKPRLRGTQLCDKCRKEAL